MSSGLDWERFGVVTGGDEVCILPPPLMSEKGVGIPTPVHFPIIPVVDFLHRHRYDHIVLRNVFRLIVSFVFVSFGMYVCMVITYSKRKDQPGKVANAARGQLNRQGK